LVQVIFVKHNSSITVKIHNSITEPGFIEKKRNLMIRILIIGFKETSH